MIVSSQSHPRYGESGVIEADAPNHWQQIVTFADGERLLVNNSDLADLNDAIVSESSERTYPNGTKKSYKLCRIRTTTLRLTPAVMA
ncbi:hypothetical protein [Nostoc sp. KVJ20]|uniref:hypothetical protein n=1 Tax=Nostoc sp. KVJ20 TaxID=457944 RepID=UPI00114CEAE1|nr:hypothetical protein [Nostoc sp. KVJ20]